MTLMLRRGARRMVPGTMVSIAILFACSSAHATQCATFMPGMPRVTHAQPADPGRAVNPPATPYGPPPSPGIGDTWLWYVWSLAGFPTATLKPATVRGMGEHCYVVVEDSQWNVSMNQADVDRIVAAFDSSSVGPYPAEGVWDLNTSTFGQPPDPLDHDPRIYLFYYDFDVAADGFFWVYDQFPDGSESFASNECEVIYMDCVTSDPGGDYMIAVMAHEFQHLIHWNYDEDEDAWVNEGISEYAMWLYGHPDPLSGFAALPDNDLTVWGSAGVDYQQTYLFMLYLAERFGGRPAMTTLVNQPANGITGVNGALTALGFASENFTTVFKDWCVANYLDDTTIGDGRYGYQGENVPHFTGRRFTSYPQSPPSTTVNKSAADYIVWTNGTPSLTVGFNGIDTGQFGLYLVQMGGGFTSVVDAKTLTAAQDGSWNLPGFATWVDSVLMVVENTRTTGGLQSYTFTGAINPTGAVGEGTLAAGLAIAASPSPSAGDVRFIARNLREGDAVLSIFGADGRRVGVMRAHGMPGASHEFAWDGRDGEGRAVPAGMYWARLSSGGTEATTRVVITR